MKSKLIFVVILMLITLTTNAQEKTNNSQDLDYLIKFIKNNYPGYEVKVNTKTKRELKKLEKDLKHNIKLYPDSSTTYLRRYASWFKDNHLRVITKNVKKKKNYNKEQLIFRNIDLDKLNNSKKILDGIWISFYGKVAIEKDSNKNIWYGIAIEYDSYKRGQVIFTLVKSNNSKGFVYKKGTENIEASINLNNRVLEIHGNSYFVKQTKDTKADKALLYTYRSNHPNGQNTYYVALPISDSTFYLRAAGFGSDYTNRLVKKHWNDIVSRPNLIIDIRYNGGGQDIYYQMLSKLIYTNPYYSYGVKWYATDYNIKLYEDALKNGEISNKKAIENVKAMIIAMKKNKGKFINHPIYGHSDTIKKDTIYSYPKKVGIIINEHNASSAEQFLLTAKHSKKVTIFGNKNTAGILDYSNCVTVELPSKRYSLVYPLTRSCRLPENPIDNIGISPQIRVPFPATKQLYGELDTWIYFVKKYLEL